MWETDWESVCALNDCHSACVAPLDPETVRRADWRAYRQYPDADQRLRDKEGDGDNHGRVLGGSGSRSAAVTESFGASAYVADHDRADGCDEAQHDTEIVSACVA